MAAASRLLDAIRARLAPGWRSFNKEAHQEENSSWLCTTMSACVSARVCLCTAVEFTMRRWYSVRITTGQNETHQGSLNFY